MIQKPEIVAQEMEILEILNNSRVGLLLLDKQLNVVYANQRMFELFDKPFTSISGKQFGDAFSCTNLSLLCNQCNKEKNQACHLMQIVENICNGNVVDNQVVDYTFSHNAQQYTKWFQVSGCTMYTSEASYVSLVFTDISNLKEKEERLKKMLTLDLATGTQNKYSLMKLVRKRVEALQSGQRYTLCMIDFDNFKLLNDAYGHLFGDTVLEKFSDIAHRYIQKKDVLGRYGGEEFIFIFDEMQEEQVFSQLNDIHSELTEYFADFAEIPVTFSAGIVTVTAEDNENLSYKDLICKADACLYQAKQHGRSRAKSSTREKVFGEN